MNKIGENQVDDVLGSFEYDSAGQEESDVTRKKERQDSHIFLFRDYYNIRTYDGVLNTSFLEPQKNTFGCRKRWQEEHVVSLTTFDRGAFQKLRSENDKAQFLVNFFNRERYSKAKRERYIINYFAHQSFYNEEMMEEFLTKYFAIENYTKEERTRFSAKCYTNEQVASLDTQELEKYTNLGEEYNMSSLIYTIEEHLESGEQLIIAEGKSKESQAVIDYLKYLELERQIINLQQQVMALGSEEETLNQEIISLQKKLRGIKTQRTTLQQQQKDLQEIQDELLK